MVVDRRGDRAWVSVRAVHVLADSFPLNDGGLFYVMTRDLQEARYRLPVYTSYDGSSIPFGYSPLGFYLAATLADTTPPSVLDALRLLPLLASSLSVGAFALLARTLLPSRTAVVIATFAFALVPRGFIWLIMGGGLTRSLGLLFALLALRAVCLLYRRRELRHALPAAAFAALTVLSHLETAWFLALSSGVCFLAYGRHRRGVAGSVLVAGATVLLTMPWWAVVLARHGIEPFLAARQTGGTLFSGDGAGLEVLLALMRVDSTSEPLFPLVGMLALLGAFVSLTTRRFLLPAWWAVTVVLEARAFKTYVVVPQALLAATALVEVLLPMADRLRLRAYESRLRARLLQPSSLLLGLLTLTAVGSAVTASPTLGGENAYLVSLSGEERAAMDWVARETPTTSRFLVLPTSGWPTDKTLEWFPALTGRRSIVTAQGAEWLPQGAFARLVAAHDEVSSCGERQSICLDTWATKHRLSFTHVYVPKQPERQCCWTLLTSLDNDPRYQLIYDGPGATIFARQPDEPNNPTHLSRLDGRWDGPP